MSVVGGCAADATAVVSWLGRAVPYVPRSGSGPSVYLAGSDQGLTKIPKVRRRPNNRDGAMQNAKRKGALSMK